MIIINDNKEWTFKMNIDFVHFLMTILYDNL